jgi:hypothetical protein
MLFTMIALGSYFALRSKDFWKLGYVVSSVFFSVIVIVFNCLLWRFWDHFRMASDMIAIAGEFFWSTRRLIYVPFIHTVVAGLYSTLWFAGFMHLYSMNKFSITTYESGFIGKIV